MSEYDNLDELFAQFVAGGPLAIPAGADAARAVIRKRRQMQGLTVGALTALAIAVPMVAFASDMGKEVVPAPADNGPTSPPPTPSVSDPPSPTVTAPDGRISLEELGNAKLEVPAWPARAKNDCAAGTVEFTDGTVRRPGVVDVSVKISKVVHLDVDGDGAAETAARLACKGLEHSEVKVIAFDRNAAGEIVTLGQVVTNTGGIAFISDIRAAGNAVEAEVRDHFGDGLPDDLSQRQWRAYSWDGHRFVQSGGPSTFPPSPKITDLAIAGDNLRLSPAGEEKLTGNLALTIRNNGPQRAEKPRVVIRLPKQLAVSKLPAGCTSLPWQNGVNYVCDLAPLAVGAQTTVTLTVTADRSDMGTGSIGNYSAEVAWFRPSSDGGGTNYPEPEGKRGNNSIERQIIFKP
ncbi:MAG TPA: hypothetical protein VFX61_02230 [Micromonosporaceae bacterium]|nr:hypothetical protein [Micromonosporaceae bacterium]